MKGRGRFALVLAFLAANLIWGLDEAMGIEIAEEAFAIEPALSRTYGAVGELAEVCGAFLIARGLLASQGRTMQTVSIALVVLGGTGWAVAHVSIPWMGYVLRFVAGLSSVVIGILCQNALVLRQPVSTRARLSGVLTASAGVVMVASKASAGYVEREMHAVEIYSAGGQFVLLTVLVAVITRRFWLSRDPVGT